MITLIRHGKVLLDEQRRWRASELRDLIACYDRSSVKPPEMNPVELPEGTVIMCSDLRRSTDSAMLAFNRFDTSDPLFREAELPDLPALPFRSANVLLALSRISWSLGRSTGCESFSQFRVRCETAASALIDRHHQTGAPIILVGHGFLNHYVAKELCRRGWKGPRSPSARHWAVSVYRPAGGDDLR